MIRIRTPSRLHFGLLSLPTPGQSNTGGEVVPRRSFGGVGLMIEQPGIELTVRRAREFSAAGPHAERALRYAATYCDGQGIVDRFHLEVAAAAPEHVGLGTGTQLGLAVARAIAELTGQRERGAVHLASQVGRGKRSALGVHGFDRGGFLVEGGKCLPQAISPLLMRCDFPADWRILLALPRARCGTHGAPERDAFAHLEAVESSAHLTDAMSRIVLLGMLPALLERDLEAFGEALFDYNRRAGGMFRSVQGGVYADTWIDAMVRLLRDTGVKGVGQSSWGPTVFAVATTAHATDIHEWLQKQKDSADMQIVVSAACNRGAVAESVNPCR